MSRCSRNQQPTASFDNRGAQANTGWQVRTGLFQESACFVFAFLLCFAKTQQYRLTETLTEYRT